MGLEDNLAPPRFGHRTIQPVASRYSDCTIPAAIWNKDWESYIHSPVRIHSQLGLSCDRFIADQSEFGGGDGDLVRSAAGVGRGRR